MEKYALSVCLAAELNYELKAMLHQHLVRLDICDSVERAEERIRKQRFCLIIFNTTALYKRGIAIYICMKDVRMGTLC